MSAILPSGAGAELVIERIDRSGTFSLCVLGRPYMRGR